MTAAESIVALAAALEAQRPPAGSPAAIFVSGIHLWLSEGGTLDQALNLVSSGPGKDSARTLFLRKQRDFHLQQAHRLCEGGSHWSRSVTLAAEVNRFESILWPRWRDREEPPEGCSGLRGHLFFARKSGELPASITGLHRICAATTNPRIHCAQVAPE